MTPTSLLPSLQGMHLSTALLLPVETLFHVFAQLEDPRDLYRASLVCRTWHRAAIDDRLWEDFFWQYYRPCQSGENASEEEITLERYRERKRRAAMLSWLRIASSSPPSCEFFEHRSDIVWEAKKELDEIKAMARPKGVSRAAHEKAIQAAEHKFNHFYYHHKPLPLKSPQPLLAPPFLQAVTSQVTSEQRSSSSMPNFYRLFAARLKKDDEIIDELRAQASLTRNQLHGIHELIVKYRSSARHILTTVCSSQRIADKDVEDFLPPIKDEDPPLPRAIELHVATVNFETVPHGAHCLALLHIAEKALGNLQRGEAIGSMQQLQNGWKGFKMSGCTSQRAALEASAGAVEHAMEDVALFRGAERIQLREYLDLLALFVSADLQAQDHGRERENNIIHRVAADETLPEGSTRYQLARIVTSLRTLGYGVAAPPDSMDIDNAFVNLALFVRCQRPTSPLTLTAIVCAVARRLGIAATISTVTTRAVIIAAEDAEQPAAWRSGEEQRQWARFFVDAADEEGRSVGRPGQIVYEVDEVVRFLRSSGARKEELHDALEPASPLAVLDRVANDLRITTRAERSSLTRHLGSGRYEEEQIAIHLRARDDPLARLRMYLDGRIGNPPAPLHMPILASTLGHGPLPSTMIYALRSDPARLKEDAMYCATWIHRIVAPEKLGGLPKSTEAVASMIGMDTANNMYGPDYPMLIAVDKVLPANSPSREELSRSLPPDYFFRFIVPLMEADGKRGSSLGSAAGDDAEVRELRARDNPPRRLIDRSFPSNKDVNFGVGTLFTHTLSPWRGVIVGWDSECRKCKHWIEQRGVDLLPSGGRYQPFYHCITEYSNEAYVPQCHVLPMRIAPGSSRQDAASAIQDFCRLFTVPLLGRAFRTLRVVPWDGAEEAQEKGKSKSKLKKEKRKEEKRMKSGSEREKGQVYLVMNDWMKEVWPYG